MHEDPDLPNFIANRFLRSQFLARFMAAHTKNHKVTNVKRRKSRRPLHHRVTKPKAHDTVKLPMAGRPASKPETPPKDDEEPRAEDLAKQVPIKPEEVEQAPVVVEPEEPAAPRLRERSAYDGDTAIKLYLREIGQVKLLT